ncbi:MAG TPA: alpha/beta hydrolase [candidate division Zixibacteria bacterium]|nr:alpha/beta hydrolase [candidate division Zixibacteria bacterium]
MPSIRAHIFKRIAKYSVGAKFKRAGSDLNEWRKIDDFVIRNTSAPEGTIVEPVELNGLCAEWVSLGEVQQESAAIYLHGGGFIMGSPRTHRELAARLSGASKTRMLVIDYRLAPEHPFPAALMDVATALDWLVAERYPMERLFIGGDSAGGGLALQTLLHLKEQGRLMPAAAFFLSPPLDWVRFDGESYTSKASSDPLITREMCKQNGAHYVGENPVDTPLLYPIGMDLSGLPPLCIHVGECEVLLSDSVRLAERAQASGVEVELKVWSGMWHVFQSNARYVQESHQSIEEIGRFIHRFS